MSGAEAPEETTQAPDPALRWQPTPRLFLGALVAAALFEFAYLLGLFERRAEVDGVAMATLFTLLIPAIPPLLGLATIRRRSRLAQWVLIGLVAVAIFSAVKIGTGPWKQPAILAGACALMLQSLAVTMLFTRSGRRWTEQRTT